MSSLPRILQSLQNNRRKEPIQIGETQSRTSHGGGGVRRERAQEPLKCPTSVAFPIPWMGAVCPNSCLLCCSLLSMSDISTSQSIFNFITGTLGIPTFTLLLVTGSFWHPYLRSLAVKVSAVLHTPTVISNSFLSTSFCDI